MIREANIIAVLVALLHRVGSRVHQVHRAMAACDSSGLQGGLPMAPPRIHDETLLRLARKNDVALTVWHSALARSFVSDGGYILCHGDADYPPRIYDALGTDAPAVLFCQGDGALAAQPMVGIVGTRRASEVGRRAASDYAAELTQHGLVVVSGNARGVDAAAHEGALAAGGATVVCIPVSFENYEPTFRLSHPKTEADRVLILSPYPLGTLLEKRHFLERNALIAALGRAHIVPETGPRGGTHNTIAHANRLGLSVLVVRLPNGEPNFQAHRLLLAGGEDRALPPKPDTAAMERVLRATAEGGVASARWQRRGSDTPDIFSEAVSH